jgi:MFS transporter, DHA1 family, multidrug resistance protein
MAKTMSLVFMVLMLSPIFAPALGQFLLVVLDWRGLFMFMAGLCAIVTLWVWMRLPETLKPEHRRPLGLMSMIAGFGIVFSNRVALSYILATALLFGGLFGFLTSSQQIYTGIYGVGLWFPAFFAAGGVCAAMGGFANSQLVSKFGMKFIALRALALFCVATAIMLVLGYFQMMTVWVFFALSAVTFFTFSMIMPNFGALAMEPLGEVAGTAASAQGVLQMVLGAAIGAFIGQMYNGTTVPLAMGMLGLALLAGVLINLMVAKRANT